MYEKITAYLEFFGNDALPEAQSKEKIDAFTNEFMSSGWMNPNAMEAMGERAFAGKAALREAASTMSAEEVCTCLSAFIQQDAFIPGILPDLIQQGVIPQMLKRLKELDS